MTLTRLPLIGAACVLVALASSVQLGRAQSSAENDAITRTALDYIEGFYTGDAARMERALHPQLAKRIMRVDPATGAPRLDQQDAARLIAITKSRAGATPPAKQQKDVTVLDVYGNAATVKVVANDWIDYLHVVKWEGRWQIVNVLWEMKAK
jgi:hypothetical protein